MGIKIERVRQKNKKSNKTGDYYNSVPGTDLGSPTQYPDEVVRKTTDRKKTFEENLGMQFTPSQLYSRAGLSRKVKPQTKSRG